MKVLNGGSKESFSDHVRQFNDLCNALNFPWTKEKKLAKFKWFLGYGPREVFDALSNLDKVNVERAAAKLQEVYESYSYRESMRIKAKACVQGKVESIKVFGDRLWKMVKAAYGNKDRAYAKKLFLDLFLENANPEVICQLRLDALNVVEKAADIERIPGHRGYCLHKLMNENSKNDAEGKADAGKHAQPSKVKRRLCYKCGNPGHVAAACYGAEMKFIKTYEQPRSVVSERSRYTIGLCDGAYGVQRQRQLGMIEEFMRRRSSRFRPLDMSADGYS